MVQNIGVLMEEVLSVDKLTKSIKVNPAELFFAVP